MILKIHLHPHLLSHQNRDIPETAQGHKDKQQSSGKKSEGAARVLLITTFASGTRSLNRTQRDTEVV